jgi:triosephosphate isomerase (TIM)
MLTALTAIRPLIAGNWKMNGLEGALAEARALAQAIDQRPPAARVALCPPATLISRLAATLAGVQVEVGGQDCHERESGAFTGDISAEMLADAGASLVILGHSERREFHGESDQTVAAKVEAALRAGLEPIVCVGELLDQRKAGEAVAVVEAQLQGSLPAVLAGKAFCVAYEPVWAIGSGLTPTLEEIAEVHFAIRAALCAGFGDQGAGAPILYGGSVKAGNAAEILRVNDVDGALVGGASLKAADFIQIVQAA